MATISPPLSPPLGIDAPSRLRGIKDKAIRTFCTTPASHAYSSSLFLRRFLELQLPELPYQTDPGCSSHTMLLLPDQTYENEEESFLSILCAECRYHFHVATYKACTRGLDDSKHPSHMLIPFSPDSQDHKHAAKFICAVEDCFYNVKISVMPPKLSTWQIGLLRDDSRILRNLYLARKEDPSRYSDIPDTWGAGSTVPTLAKYIEDRLAKPGEEVLKIKKRNKRFCVSFGKDFDDLLRSLGFEERTDEEGEECWYITEAETVPIGSPTPVATRRAYLQDTLEELRTFLPTSNTTPAWAKLMDAFPGYLSRRETDLVTAGTISEDDVILLGCLKEFSPRWFSWAAILLASISPSRRDIFLDAGLRCIQERSEEASLSIIMYKSQFDQMPSVDPQVQTALDFFGASLEDCKDTSRILDKYRALVPSSAIDSLKSEASQHLEIISNHLGADLLVDVARGDSLAIPTPSVTPNNKRMSIASASRLLKVDAAFTAELIREFVANLDEQVDRSKVVEALEVLSDLKSQQDKSTEAQSLKEAADFLRATEDAAMGQLDHSKIGQSSTVDSAAAFTAPPGLKNIGNTCYLNSLLQYFYNVKPIRDMVLNYDQIQLGLDDASVSNRRTGGNGQQVTLEEAIVARQFVEELRHLFLELQTTTGTAASPSQKLANTALSSAKEILTSRDQNQPPPLPARPSPVPVLSSAISPTLSPDKKLSTVNVTVEPINEQHCMANSLSSSQTLVNELDDTGMGTLLKEQTNDPISDTTGLARELSPEDRALSDTAGHVEDTVMEEPPVLLSLEQKISQISQRLEQSDRSGTSQQDVEEIIGNILEHLMRAIHPNGPMGGIPDLQADKITELFFTTIVNSTIKTVTEDATHTGSSSIEEDVLNEEVIPERWITAFPHPAKEKKMKNSLYEALDRYFSYEFLSDSGFARYTTIRALPPIVHICIQRSDASGVKNKNPVIIPEELYMDRYMEAAPGSDLWNSRRRVWAVKDRIKELESRVNSVDTVFKIPGSQGWDSYTAANTSEETYTDHRYSIDLNSKLWQDMSPLSKRTAERAELSQLAESKSTKRTSISYNEQTGSFNFADTLWEAGQTLDDADFADLATLRKEEACAFDSMKRHKFLLHAMICHSGGMNAGHYWVWIRDFKNQVWYKYNDSLVTKDSRDSQQVIDELNNSGDPYYVAYVRDELKNSLVEVPQRAQPGDNDVHMSNVSEELEVIDSIAVDTPPQPANSPINESF
ncbi:cysteine proteinase [Xylaria sp. FL1042]|nr:cysteine proteinase [Xylaria sp. FL1042]